MPIGEKLREIRKKRQKTLRQVQEETGLSFSNVAEVERGEHSVTIDTLKILAKYYDVPLDYFAEDEKGEITTTSSLSGVQLALYNGTKDLNETQMQEILNFVEFVKSKK